MQKTVVQTPKVPPARVPLSQAIKVGHTAPESSWIDLE
jgi:hypothetical protein